MKLLSWSFLAFVALRGMAEPTYGQQPPDSVVSDGCFNTAMGGGALASNQNGTDCASSGFNTAAGYGALNANTTGQSNTAYGAYALHANTGATTSDPAAGGDNTAVGVEALYSNTTGVENTAIGLEALYLNTIGYGNTAAGFAALNRNTTGTYNSASGVSALYSNTTGNNNTATGYTALNNNMTGSNNTATGYGALFFSKTGQDNTATGYEALVSNTTGNYNTALGYAALYTNETGSGNTAFGIDALYRNKSGRYNIAEGYRAGYDLTTGSYNIDIGNVGVAAEGGAIRIGTSGQQTQTFIAGISTSKLTGSAVYVTSSGQLGVLASSERYKTAIAPMGSDTAKLSQLRPVSFSLKTDALGTRQYGLIAEEVAKVYPELVIRDESGRIDGVRYDELAPMLLNVVQRQQQTVLAQGAQIRDLKQQMAEMKVFNRTTQDLLRKLQAQEELVARR